MFERILVPLDGSKVSEMVLPYAVELASMFNSSIVIAGVSESSGWQAVVESRTYLETQTDHISDALLKRQPFEKDNTLHAKVSFQSFIGNPASEILNYASSIEADLIILASRGASGGGLWPLGNVAEKILRGAKCPVLLIREHLDNSVVSLKYILRKILVPLDGSKLSEAALPLAIGLAKETGSELVLFQVIKPMDEGGFGNLPPDVIEQYKTGFHTAPRDYLEKTKSSMIEIHSSISIATGERTEAERIIDYSEANHCDLIAMSPRGQSGFSRWAFGSVTDKVLHAGKKPVLIVKPTL